MRVRTGIEILNTSVDPEFAYVIVQRIPKEDDACCYQQQFFQSIELMHLTFLSRNESGNLPHSRSH